MGIRPFVYIAALFAAFTLIRVSTAQPVPVTPMSDSIALAQDSFYYEDTNGILGIEQVVQDSFQANFVANNADILHFGLTRSVYWIKFTLDWQSTIADQAWILEVGPPKHVPGIARGGVNAYIFDQNRQLQFSEQLGTYSSEIELKTLEGGYALKLNSTSSEIFLRVESARELRLPLTLWNESAFRANELNANTSLGIKYGILIAMIFYNLFLFVSIKERSFIFYVLVVGTQLAFLILDSKHARLINEGEFINPWLINMLERNIYIFMAMAHLQFQRQLLHIWEYNRRLNNTIKILIGLFGFSLLVSLIPDEKYVQNLYIPLIIIGILLALYTNIDAIKRGIDTAIVHLLAVSVLIAGAAVQLLHQVFNVLPANSFVDQAFEIGMVVQAMLLSFSLAFRYNQMKKSKEEAQQLAIAHLQHSESIKDELLANVSHELRTPVHGITGLTEVVVRDLQSDTNSKESAIEKLQLIGSSGNRLIRLIDDLLDLSRIKNQGINLQLVAINLHEFCSNILLTSNIFRNNGAVRIHNDVAENLPWILADKDRLHQILLNLLTNAVKFTQQGGIWITASIEEPGFVTISVRDTGIGISQEDKSRIFNSFEKGHVPADMQPGGAGLGLAISKHLVELHGSQLEVQSVLGKGSVFHFRLPLASANTPTDDVATLANAHLLKRSDFSLQPRTAMPETTESGAEILIVDDDAINRQVIREQLGQHRLLEASSGAEAIAMVSRQKPDLVLLDLMMPGLNGYEVCRHLRQRFDPAELPIIIVTAKNHLEDLTEGFLAGANDYLSKPFHMEELRARVSSQLKLKHLQQASAENARLRLHIQDYIKASQQLRTSRHQIESVLDSLDLGTVALAYPGIVVHVNQSAQKMLGVTSSQLNGRTLIDLLTDSTSNDTLKEFISRWEIGERQANSEQIISVEIRIPFSTEGSDAPTERVFKARFSLLSDDDSTAILFIETQDNEKKMPVENLAGEPQLLESLSGAMSDARTLNARLKFLSMTELTTHPEVTEYFQSMRKLVGFLEQNLSSIKSQGEYREQIVHLMQKTLAAWEHTTGKSKIELAENSRIWAVSIDEGRLRTRTLDRYLRVDLLPKAPRWREVLRTTYFVLSDLNLLPELREELELELEKLKSILQNNDIV